MTGPGQPDKEYQVRISKDEFTYVVEQLAESLDDIPDGAIIDLAGGDMEQSFRLPPRWLDAEGNPIDGGDPPGEGEQPDRFVQVMFLPGSQEIFDRAGGA